MTEKKAPATDVSSEQVATPTGDPDALTPAQRGDAPGGVGLFAVFGADGRRVKRGLIKPDAEAFADELAGRTGEKLKVKPDEPSEE